MEGSVAPILKLSDYKVVHHVVDHVFQVTKNKETFIIKKYEGNLTRAATPDGTNLYPGHILGELDILTRLRHPNILQAVGFVADSFYPWLELYVIMVDAGQMLCVYNVQTTSLQQRVQWMRALADGLAFLHAQGIFHGDLKAQNIAIDAQQHLTILDFGLSGVARPHYTELSVFCTPGWQAPQATFITHHETVVGLPLAICEEPLDPFKADLYSLGVLYIYLLAEGRVLGESDVSPQLRQGGITWTLAQFHAQPTQVLQEQLGVVDTVFVPLLCSLTEASQVTRGPTAAELCQHLLLNQPPSITWPISPCVTPPPPLPIYNHPAPPAVTRPPPPPLPLTVTISDEPLFQYLVEGALTVLADARVAVEVVFLFLHYFYLAAPLYDGDTALNQMAMARACARLACDFFYLGDWQDEPCILPAATEQAAAELVAYCRLLPHLAGHLGGPTCFNPHHPLADNLIPLRYCHQPAIYYPQYMLTSPRAVTEGPSGVLQQPQHFTTELFRMYHTR